MVNAKLTTENKDVAWMLKHTGELIPVSRGMHIYGVLSDDCDHATLEENTAVASFLYKYDRCPEAIKTLQVYVARILYHRNIDIENLTEQNLFCILNRIRIGCEYRWLRWSQVEYEKHSVPLFDVWKQTNINTNKQLEQYYYDNIHYNSNVVNSIVNNNFARVRFGITADDWFSTYDTSNNLIFRISSQHDNKQYCNKWEQCIVGALEQITQLHPSVATITVVRDPESTGKHKSVYQNTSGNDIWFMDIVEFLSQPLALSLCNTVSDYNA